MAVRDQFLTAPAIAYSGSYQDAVFWKGSSIFSSGSDRLRGNETEIVFDRYVVASKANKQVFPDITVGPSTTTRYKQYLASDAIKLLKKAAIGTTRPFIRFTSNNEVFYDCFGPSMPETILKGNGELVLHASESNSTLSGDNFKYNYPKIQASSSFDITLTNTTKSVDSKTHHGNNRIADNIWVYSFPFEHRYRNIGRTLKPSSFFPNAFSLSTARTPGSTEPFTADDTDYYALSTSASLNQLNTIFVHLETKAISSDFFVLRESIVKPSNLIQSQSLIPSIDNINELFYGIGNEKSHFVEPLKFPQENSTISVSSDLILNAGVLLRGAKYGMLNPNPLRSNAVFRYDHYGQFRDMLEQRLFAKFYDSVGVNQSGRTTGQPAILSSPVNIKFVSGSDAAVTASNPTTLNPTVSGLYDFEAKSGKPFDDAR